ncbi:hypothetical protein L6164_000740 [Bauhinia variegata]|uniref:Uncharacterized protein n=1 Tax=Bauhinia variegata TaxID=167791 RepID=A0ACB9QA49_BAUVA|nr:hypothetical protein L6164_000740 [Bauhinia variegata]
MDILISIAGKISAYAVASIVRQVGYLIFFGRNVKKLKTQVEKLQTAKERVGREIDEATRNAQEIETDVRVWLNKVDEMVEEAKMIYGDEGKASRIPENVRDYKALESRTNTINEIMKTLQDSSIHTIGVWGLDGVGKTTLAKEVRRQTKEKNLFGAVIMTTITDKPNVEEVQKEIADSLGFELERFGIPLGDEHKGYKLLLIYRNLDLLKSEIGIQKAFQLEVLKEDEAQILFEKMAADVVKDRQAIATEIVKRCACLRMLKLHRLTNELKDKILLIEDTKRWVTIHDLVREAAASLATQNQTAFYWKAYTEVKKWPERNRLHKCKQIFFAWCYLCPLPKKLETPELQILELANDSYPPFILRIPDSFFEETRNLEVLYIAGMDCTPKPPTSLGFLKSLTALSLFECKLEDTAMVGELTNLQILSLSRADIRELPREIGMLHQLRLLDLDACTCLKVIPHNVISNLTRLEELYMGDGFVNWDVEVEGKTNASLYELEELKHHLTSIDLHAPDVAVWPVDLFFEKLERFRIYIGDVWTLDGVYESKILKLKLNRSIQLEHGIKMTLKHVEILSLDEMNGVKDVLYDLHGGGFPLLNHLTVQNNGEIETIAASSGRPIYAFPNLETLSLYNLSNLEHIYHGCLTQESFCKLRVVKVQDCHKLKCLFISSMSKAFSSLVEIEVLECSLLETLVLSGGAEFSELRSLTLQGLPALVSFSSLEAKQINGGDNASSFLVPLFNDKVQFPKLETTTISQIVGLTTLWNQQVNANSFCTLKSIEIKYCNKLVTIFPASIVRNLHDLETLTISNCNSVEVIFELQGPNDKISSFN